MNAISFGTVATPNNHGEIVLLPGDYYPGPNQGLVQLEADWRQAASPWVYRNVSVRGMGTVRVHGDSMGANQQMIFLMGNGVSVKNISLLDCRLHGIYFNGSPITHHTDVLVDSVIVDGAIGFGIFFNGYERILAEHSTVNNTCRENANEINGSCLWPSGLRADDCAHVTFRENVVSRNWGEGLNTSYCHHVDVTDNVVFDNYSVNMYVHSSSKTMFRNNLVYNSDSTYWRYCYNSHGSSAYGISVANELSCTYGCALYSNGCGSTQSCCSFTDYDHPFYQSVLYTQLDCVFIYNNFLFEAGVNIWDAFSSFGNNAYMNHIYIEHNTIIGRAGSDTINKAPIILTLGTGYIYFSDVKVRNNIFSIDNNLPNAYDFFAYAAAPACNGAWTNNFTSFGNLWRFPPSIANVNFFNDANSIFLPAHAVVGDTAYLTPCPSRPELYMPDAQIPYITDDYFHNTRMSTTNAGAVEYDVNANLQPGAAQFIPPGVFPNPAHDYFTLTIPSQTGMWNCTVMNANGQVVASRPGLTSNTNISTEGWAAGVYFVRIANEDSSFNLKITVCD